MPIFIDSHDLKGLDATAAEAAMAHEADLAIQEAYDVNFLTYWFDAERGEAFCLVDAPNAEAVSQVHEKAHGGVPTLVFAVDIDEVRNFLGRVADPQPPEDDPSPPYSFLDSGFRVIMFTDMQDSTTMTRLLGDEYAIDTLEIHDAFTREAVEAHSGRIVKHTGDGFMAAFPQVGEAVSSAIALQRLLASHNKAHPERPIHVRIGLNAGVPVDRSGDLFGITVQLAARICAEADAEQILAAGIIHELCDDPELLPAYHEYGRFRPKGFLSAVSLFEIEWNEA
jgi:class 3 adenylate cyclase